MQLRGTLQALKSPSNAAWRQAIRMTSAALLAYVATGFVGLHHGYWALITCLVIIQGSVGATISAGLSRLAGTAVGAVAGGIGALLLLVPGFPEWLVLLLVTAPMALLASTRAIFKLAPLTGALVLLLAGSGSLAFALSRVAEIALGTVIGVLAALFVLPQRATAILVEHAATILEQLGAFAAVLLAPADPQAHDRAGLKLRGLYAQLQNDMAEIQQERSAHLLRNDAFPEQLARHLQRLRTDVNMIGRACAAGPEGRHDDLAERIRQAFLGYADVLRQRADLPAAPRLDDPGLAGATNTPLGFAVLTLQVELQALHETLAGWTGAAEPPKI